MGILRRKGGSAQPVKDLVTHFWARGPGATDQLAAIADAARRARLSAEQLRMIRAAVPECDGPTGQRCARVREVLDGLAQEAG